VRINAKWPSRRQPSTLPLLHVRTFDFKSNTKLMTESNTPPDPNELARLRALVADYETKLTNAASLVARVRHEINNPLAALLGQAQLLLREPDLSERAHKRASTIESQAKRIEEIVGELRDIQTPVRALNRQVE
jgi:signal transduction histidine kinase